MGQEIPPSKAGVAAGCGWLTLPLTMGLLKAACPALSAAGVTWTILKTMTSRSLNPTPLEVKFK